MNRRVKHMRPNLKPVSESDQSADAGDQPAQAPAPNRGLRLDASVNILPGPDGRQWVSVQHNQGALAGAFALAPEDVEQWLRVIGRDMRAAAAQARAMNGGSAHRSGLIVAGPGDVPRFPTA